MIDQLSFIMLYFESHPDEEIDSYDVEETIRRGWLGITGEKFRDPGRALRQLRAGGYISSRQIDGILHFKFERPYRNLDPQ